MPCIAPTATTTRPSTDSPVMASGWVRMALVAQRRSSAEASAAAVTIRDVAAKAGVSVATVSRVLNGKELVREETSTQVLEAARSLRYVPNVAARALSIRRSNTIGIVLPEVHGQFFSEVIRGIDVAARWPDVTRLYIRPEHGATQRPTDGLA